MSIWRMPFNKPFCRPKRENKGNAYCGHTAERNDNLAGTSSIPYFDGHCDTIWRCVNRRPAAGYGDTEEERLAYFAACRALRENGGHVDLLRGQDYRRRAQFFALYDDVRALPEGTAWQQLRRMHDWFLGQLEENRDLAALCTSGAETDAAVSQRKTAALLSIEGADLLDCDIAKLETVAAWGVRMINPVWNNANALSGSCMQDSDRGLSAEGAEFVAKMEELGITVDVSHISDAGFRDVIRMAKRPVAASHSNARALCPHRRNLTDDMFRAIRDTGGVVGINLYRSFVGGGTMEELVAHIEHFLALDGEATVAIGGDLDGCRALAAGITGVQDVAELYRALEKRGYGKPLLEDIFWNNWRRML